MAVLSQAVEDYLKAIYTITRLPVGSPADSIVDGASTTAIAKEMQVSSASVTNMLKRLSEMKLVNYTSYKGVTLTEAGTKIALEVIRHHRLLELYLHQIMGYSWDKVHDEAEYLEHHISEEFEDKIAEMLGDPKHDPHGDPIPTKEGLIPETTETQLSTIQSGETVTIKRVSDRSSEMLRYLAQLGLLPNVIVEVISHAPFDGPLTLRLGERDLVIGEEVARNIYVAP